jgi:hypothetical protein
VRRPVTLLVLGLFALAALTIVYRVIKLGYPVLPTAPGQAWQLSAHAHIKPDNGGVSLAIGLPSEYANRVLFEERVSSGTLHFNIIDEGRNRFGIWSGEDVLPGEELVTYHATILLRHKRFARRGPEDVERTSLPVGSADTAIVERLASRWSKLAPRDRILAVAGTVVDRWKGPVPDEHDLGAWSIVREKYGQARALLILFRASEIPARLAEGLILREGVTTAPIKWIEAWDGAQWSNISVEKGEALPDSVPLLPLATGGIEIVKVAKGQLSDVRWTVTRQKADKWGFLSGHITRSSRFIDRWSLFHLPPEYQRTFRILILVPLGALMICVLRNIIGFPTFGIFMPVLMALSFRSTGLIYGIGIFVGVILFGYAVRRHMDRLRLLLVPRMSVLLTLVIACFVVLALVGNKLGIHEFMAVGLLPFVILTMTIERFFVLVEESGSLEAFRTAGGSAAVALLTYQIISWEPLQLTFFVYPELLAAVAAVQILLGRYTGYRLSEFIRFRMFRKPS